MKFLNSHCSIACGYCFVLCLTAKSIVKMIKFSGSVKLNEIHRVDSSFDEDPKNIIFSREALILGEGRQENLGKIGNNRASIVMQNGGWRISKEHINPYPLVPKSL